MHILVALHTVLFEEGKRISFKEKLAVLFIYPMTSLIWRESNNSPTFRPRDIVEENCVIPPCKLWVCKVCFCVIMFEEEKKSRKILVYTYIKMFLRAERRFSWQQ